MTVIQKIMDWRAEQIRQGRAPESIALSPWDEKELMQWAESVGIYDVTTPKWERRIFGLEIISSEAPCLKTHG